MANEFVARKGLISLNDSQFSGSVPIYVSASGGSGADLYVSGSGTNPRVGIGITTPAQALTVLGNVSGSGNLNMGGSITGSVVSSSLAQFGSVTITAGTITGITDLVVADGGTGVSTLTDGGVLLGSGTSAITAMAVLGDSEMIVGDGTGDPVAESGATLRTSIGVGTSNNVQFAQVTGSTGVSSSLGEFGTVSIRGGSITGITDIDVADGGTGVSSLTDGGVLLGSGTSGITAMSALADGEIIVGDGSGDPVAESGATLRTSIGVGAADNVEFAYITGSYFSGSSAAFANVTIVGGSITGITDLVVADGGTGASTLTDGGVLLGSGTGAVTAMSVLADGEMIVGDGSTDPVAESGGTLRTSIGLGSTDDVTFDTGSFTGDVTITGNLIVTGTRTELQTTQLKVEDALITVASGSANSSAANGAGIEIDMTGQSNPAITWDHAGQEFDFNYPVSGSQFTGSFIGDGSQLAGLSSSLDIIGDSGTGNVNLKTQDFTISGGEGIDTSVSSQTLTIAAEDATTSNKGVSSFNTTNFTVDGGAVTLDKAITLSGSAIIQGTLYSTGSATVSTGGSETTSVIATVATGSYTSAQFDYFCQDGTNYRAGTVIGIWKGGSSIEYTDYSTPDIGDSSDAVFTMDLSSALARLKFTATAGTWTVKTSLRAL